MNIVKHYEINYEGFNPLRIEFIADRVTAYDFRKLCCTVSQVLKTPPVFYFPDWDFFPKIADGGYNPYHFGVIANSIQVEFPKLNLLGYNTTFIYFSRFENLKQKYISMRSKEGVAGAIHSQEFPFPELDPKSKSGKIYKPLESNFILFNANKEDGRLVLDEILGGEKRKLVQKTSEEMKNE